MKPYYYTKVSYRNNKLFFRFLSSFLMLFGIAIIGYVFFPLISWQIYFAPVFASANVTAPIPTTTIVTPDTIRSLLEQAVVKAADYQDAQTWFPTAKQETVTTPITSYTITIPKLNIENAVVSTTDYDLSQHLVHYGGTALPSTNGNAVIFGHSTLPQLFDPTDYKTIFAKAFQLGIGDEIFTTIEKITYRYKIFSVTVVNPTDTSVLSQQYDNAYLTLITCTPPGTTWKRLIIKARLEKI